MFCTASLGLMLSCLCRHSENNVYKDLFYGKLMHRMRCACRAALAWPLLAFLDVSCNSQDLNEHLTSSCYFADANRVSPRVFWSNPHCAIRERVPVQPDMNFSLPIKQTQMWCASEARNTMLAPGNLRTASCMSLVLFSKPEAICMNLSYERQPT